MEGTPSGQRLNEYVSQKTWVKFLTLGKEEDRRRKQEAMTRQDERKVESGSFFRTPSVCCLARVPLSSLLSESVAHIIRQHNRGRIETRSNTEYEEQQKKTQMPKPEPKMELEKR